MRFETSREIAADPAAVWAVWTDVEHWPDWTDSMTSVHRLDTGEFTVGSSARVKQPGVRAMVWTVTESEPGRSFNWSSRTLGSRMVASHVLVPGPDGRLTAQLSVEQTGPLAGLLGLLAGAQIRRYLEMEADGIKRHCESAA